MATSKDIDRLLESFVERVGKIVAHGIREQKFAPFVEHHHRGVERDFGHGCLAEKGILGHGRFGVKVRKFFAPPSLLSATAPDNGSSCLCSMPERQRRLKILPK